MRLPLHPAGHPVVAARFAQQEHGACGIWRRLRAQRSPQRDAITARGRTVCAARVYSILNPYTMYTPVTGRPVAVARYGAASAYESSVLV